MALTAPTSRRAFLAFYNDYQKRYAGQMPSATSHARAHSREDAGPGRAARHRPARPATCCFTSGAPFRDELTGGELAESSLTAARTTRISPGVEFRTIDMLDIPGRYDCHHGERDHLSVRFASNSSAPSKAALSR